MREHKANTAPAGPEASKKGWEGPSLPRLGRKGKIVRNLLLTAVFAAIVNVVMYFKLRRISMAESLKSIE